MIGKLLMLGAMMPAVACAYAGHKIPAQTTHAVAPVAQESGVRSVAEESGIRPVGQEGRWTVLFSDEFDEPTLDRGKWVTCYWWDQDGCTNLGNRELQWYQPANAALAEGELQLRADRKSVETPEGTYDFTSGLVSTGRAVANTAGPPKFDFQYGFAEIRARVPAGRGLLPAFWMLPSTHEAKPEIDIMEVLGAEPDVLYAHLHFLDPQGDAQKRFKSIATKNLSSDWHVYGVDWSAERIIWYLDGTEYWRYENAEHIPKERMYLLVNLAVGGRWPGSPDESTQFPATFTIDYVRVWQRLQ